MRIIVVISVLAISCAGCATTSPAPKLERLDFKGEMDLSGRGVGFMVTHQNGLICEGRYGSGRLPSSASIDVTCNDKQTGVLIVTKTEGIRGTVTLSDQRQGDVTFEPLRPQVVQPSSVVQSRVASTTHVRRGRSGCGSRGGPGYRLPSGKCASHRR
jgi:hypothetical protein